jgi:class 3 adenylate cyclase
MFCDLVGSTALSSRLDPEDLREVIRRYHLVISETVGSQEGFVAQYLSDGALIYFGFPVAQEDDAERAVRAALLLREGMQAVKGEGQPLHGRFGLATGLVVAGDRAEGSKASHEQQIMGETPNRAARLKALAEAGEIVIDTMTRKLVGRTFELAPRKPVDLKGLAVPVECWNVLAESQVDSRFEALRSNETAFVGRKQELGLLLRLWSEAETQGGRAVIVTAEAGLGKSRLISTFDERIRAERRNELRFFCSPRHTTTALYPIIAELTRAAGFAPSDMPEQKLEKLHRILAHSEDVPFVADLMSIPFVPPLGFEDLAPQERREGVFTALWSRFEALARNGPLLVWFEDAQWIDPTSNELLERFVSSMSSVPALLVVTCRPEFQPPWTDRARVTSLSLERLNFQECAALVQQLGGSGFSEEVLAAIAQRTDGIPLFIEELAKTLLEEHQLEAVKRLSSAESRIPATLHGLLMARLDRLGATAREAAQAGAVIGREFSYSLLNTIAEQCGIPSVSTLTGALAALVSSGLLLAKARESDSYYTFKHALVQDTAYSSLLRTERQRLHAAVAAFAAKQAQPSPEVLAYHYAGAGQPEKAAEQWFKAGEAASERSAVEEAIRSFTNARELISTLPHTHERRLRLLEITGALCNPLIVAKWLIPETTNAIHEAARLAEELSVNPPPVVLYHQWMQHIGSSNPKALPTSKLFLEIAEPSLQARANACVATSICMAGGSLELALQHSQRGLAIYDRKRDAKQRFFYTYDRAAPAYQRKAFTLHCAVTSRRPRPPNGRR